jgi:hypothetical protein
VPGACRVSRIKQDKVDIGRGIVKKHQTADFAAKAQGWHNVLAISPALLAYARVPFHRRRLMVEGCRMYALVIWEEQSCIRLACRDGF